MTFSSKLTLYDFIAMIVPGYLLLILFIPITQNNYGVIELFVLSVIAYLIGIVYHKCIECCTKSLRNPQCLIKKSYDKVCKKYECVSQKESNEKQYIEAYYLLMKNGCLNSIPTIEAQGAFIKNILPILIIYICAILCKCENAEFLFDGVFEYMCQIVILLLSILIILPFIWYGIQYKICYLVWEGYLFTKNNNNNNENNN